MSLQHGAIKRAPAACIGHDACLTGRVRSYDADALGDVGMRFDRRLDLAEFDPVSSNLDLMVHPTQVTDTAVGQPDHEVAGAVGARGFGAGACQAGLGIVDEALARQFGAMPIARGHAIAPDPQLAGHTDRTTATDRIDDAATRRRVLATNPATREDMRDAAHALFARDGKPVSVIRDSGGFVTQRVVANIVNIAADICQQRICSPKDLETAVTLGLGYPLGPLAMGDRWGPTNILEVLFNMQTVYGDTRYRPSPWLRRRGAIGLSLSHVEEA